MHSLEDDKGTITFKNPVTLEEFSKAMGAFEKAAKLLNGGKTVMITDFTKWLATTDFVNHTPSAEYIMERNALYTKFAQEADPVAKFNIFLELFCQDDYAHLIDSDDNAGEEIRQLLKKVPR